MTRMITGSTQPISFDCPRCDQPTSQFSYGPCADCRNTLRAMGPGEPDPRFKAGTRQDGSHCVNYVGGNS